METMCPSPRRSLRSLNQNPEGVVNLKEYDTLPLMTGYYLCLPFCRNSCHGFWKDPKGSHEQHGNGTTPIYV